MKKILLILNLVFSSIFCAAQESKLDLTGKYLGKNIYVQNPFAGTDTSFCTVKVLVNGKETNDEIYSSAYEIDLKKFNFNYGDSVNIQIIHKADCKPKVMHPEHITPKSTFETTVIKIDSAGNLTWKTKNETGRLPFIIEQYRWSKWVKVGEVDGLGETGAKENEYSFKITSCHSGENKFRVKQVDYGPKLNHSPDIKYVCGIPPIKMNYDNIKRTASFDAETMYEIYDHYGNAVKKGSGKSVDMSKLSPNLYYLFFDNTVQEVLIY